MDPGVISEELKGRHKMGMSEYMRGVRSKVGNILLQMPSVSIIHYDETGKILLIKHAEGGRWGTPGGAIEPGETPADAAVREMWEETGLVIEPIRILGVFGGPEYTVIYPNGDKTSYITTVFEGRKIGGRLEPRDGEALELQYFPLSDMAALSLSPFARLFLPEMFRRPKESLFAPAAWTPDLGSQAMRKVHAEKSSR